MTTETYGKISLRDAFGEALVAAGHKYSDLRVLDAGTKNSTTSQKYQKTFPDRFYSPGINEPGMIGMATGLAMNGKRVVACDMSIFLHNAYDSIRTAARQGSNLHLVIATTHTGITVGPDGGSAHDVTDLARMRLIPNFTIIAPWDGNQVKAAINTILEKPGFYYVRLNRPAIPIFTKESDPFIITKARKLHEGNRVTIVAVGDQVYSALLAAEILGPGFADVIGVATLEPLDIDTIIDSASRTGKVITVENHMYIGGLFEAVAGELALKLPTPMRRVAAKREFTTSGDPDELMKIYKLDVDAIVQTALEFVELREVAGAATN